MLDDSLIPTRLIDPATRTPVTVRPSVPPPRHRSRQVARQLLQLGLTASWLWVRRKYTHAWLAKRLRALFEQLGGLWVKAGQLISLRIDVFPADICTELANLQSRTYGFPTETARQIIEEELRAPIDVVFEEFGDKPFAAASIGQIHRARLREEGVWVAVKVLKPYTAEILAGDLVFIEWVTRLLEFFRIRPAMRWGEALWELQQIMRDEVDYRFEASAQRRMRKTLRKHGIYVPKVFSRYSTQRVLVTEFVAGVLMSDYLEAAASDPKALAAWLQENRIDSRKVGERLIQSMFRQLYEDNLYHGDVHPGNIVLLRDSEVALIDFGTTSFTEREYLQKFRLFTRALATRDYAKAADLALLLCAVLPNIDVEPVKERMIRALRAWAMKTLVKELPYHEKSLDNATVAVTKILFEENCTMEWMFLRIRRALTTLDASLIFLWPDANYTNILHVYLRKAERRSLREMMKPEMTARVMGSVATGMEIQDRFNEYTMFQSSLIRQHAQVFHGTATKFSSAFGFVVGQLALLVLAHGIIIILVFLQQHYPEYIRFMGKQTAQLASVFPKLDTPVWLGILWFDAYLFWSMRKLKLRLLATEFKGKPVAAL